MPPSNEPRPARQRVAGGSRFARNRFQRIATETTSPQHHRRSAATVSRSPFPPNLSHVTGSPRDEPAAAGHSSLVRVCPEYLLRDHHSNDHREHHQASWRAVALREGGRSTHAEACNGFIFSSVSS